MSKLTYTNVFIDFQNVELCMFGVSLQARPVPAKVQQSVYPSANGGELHTDSLLTEQRAIQLTSDSKFRWTLSDFIN